MKPEVRAILDRVRDTADFGYVAFADVNDTNEFGDNALHCLAVWDDWESAKVLIAAGIRIDQRGEHGYTPLHQAAAFGHTGFVKLLLDAGADPFARTDGDQPFTIARLCGQEHICGLISKHVERLAPDPAIKRHEAHLRRMEEHIAKLEARSRQENPERSLKSGNVPEFPQA
ncbi:MAG TPA: ankyrin repeat domain-containing protein [Terrimicrobiaceae bacterium]|nr:ankyrin repeat domain-containing protein [Terrimicrobiaceae bacterium]